MSLEQTWDLFTEWLNEFYFLCVVVIENWLSESHMTGVFLPPWAVPWTKRPTDDLKSDAVGVW